MSKFFFRTTIGSGDEPVICTLEYEYDESGVYNTELTQVEFMGVDVVGCLTEEVQSELEMEGIKQLEEPEDD
ncbi:hypothetical protein UFOVP252_40 [uncultured Caudovirales phage]|uniref:Uncharacterized protein n=1 Tax=uncultured Caudovirales phage TaxID=2100421 RepID=A0A6J5LIX6_9CAUD|nr:hypothetical protein UFOVP252_40 [uncultured Caudovirales phage]